LASHARGCSTCGSSSTTSVGSSGYASASRAAAFHQYYDGKFDREIPAGDPLERQVSPSLDCTRDCHEELCQAGRNVAGYRDFLRDTCTCGLASDPISSPLPSTIWASGVCEMWSAGQYALASSSVACAP